MEEGDSGIQKREIREGREGAKERDYWRDGREEGRIGYTNNGRRKGGRPGDRAELGKMIQYSVPWEKKGGGGKVDGLSAVGYGRYQEDGQSLGKRENRHCGSRRRGVTVTWDDGLNPIREAQDEASRIGTKPSGVMTR